MGNVSSSAFLLVHSCKVHIFQECVPDIFFTGLMFKQNRLWTGTQKVHKIRKMCTGFL